MTDSPLLIHPSVLDAPEFIREHFATIVREHLSLSPIPVAPPPSVRNLIATYTPADRAKILKDLQSDRGRIEAQMTHARETAIWAAAKFYKGSVSGIAKALAIAIGRYHESGWKEEAHLSELPPEASERSRELHRFLRNNNGKPLSTRSIYDISKSGAV